MMIAAVAGGPSTRGAHLRWIGGFLAVTICAAGFVFAPRSSAASCDPQTAVRNYLAPLEQLPPVRTLDWPNTNLPFGPDGLSLIKTSEVQRTQPLVVPGGGYGPKLRPLGFDLVNETFERPGKMKLNWEVTAQLLIFSGGKKRSLAATTKRIGALERGGRRRFEFPVPTKPGSYLVEIEFKNRSGKRLGRLGDYLRVVAPTLEAQVTLSATSLRSGETLNACLQNFGTQTLTYGPGVLIESFDGSQWSRSSIDPPGATSDIALFLGPGRQTPLAGFTIPYGAPPGLYRYVWQGTLTLASEFQIPPS